MNLNFFSKASNPTGHTLGVCILPCQVLAPTAHLVYYCVKILSRIFFKFLTQDDAQHLTGQKGLRDRLYLYFSQYI